MNEEFYRQRAREVRDIAAIADPFIKQRLLDLADRYDRQLRRTVVTPLPPAPSAIEKPDVERGDNAV